MEVINVVTIKYHANGKTRWSKGKIVGGQPHGYWEWYRPDGTLKRSGHFDAGEPVGTWRLSAGIALRRFSASTDFGFCFPAGDR